MSKGLLFKSKVIDNKSVTMTETLRALLPLGNSLSVAVGYFFLSGYELIRKEFNRIAINGGARIILGNRTDVATNSEINEGFKAYNAIGGSSDVDVASPDRLAAELEACSMNEDAALAAWQLRDLIKYGKLQIRVYVGRSEYFHSKLYLIERTAEFDGFAIVGSSNFSRGGFTGNSELNILSMDSFSSLKDWFDDLWMSEEVEIYDSRLMELIETSVKKPPSYKPPEGLPVTCGNRVFSIPAGLSLRNYQKKAIEAWFRNNGRGILEMATGAGKTKTALAAAAKLFEHQKKLALIIVCPYQHLVVQWQEECKSFGLDPILGFESRKRWEDKLNTEISSFNSGAKEILCVVTTLDTFSSPAMVGSLAKLRNHLMLLVDECHHLGAPKTLSCLSHHYTWRLGLSATPDRWHDDDGSQEIRKFFENGVVFSFPLSEAIGTYLTRYFYYPHLVYLTERESQEYLELSEKISRIYVATGKISEDNEVLKLLLMKRARIISRAENKIPLLESLVKKDPHSRFNLFYCGDSKEEGVRQVDKVVKVLGQKIGMKVHPFTSQESKSDRRLLLDRFRSGELEGLVAIRCLDEGVDVPATRTAYIMASSTNPREFVQRRGRILRKAPGKDYAYIHDFIVVPRGVDDVRQLEPTVFNIERRLMKKELARFKEFAELSENGPQAVKIILDVAKSYNLLDL